MPQAVTHFLIPAIIVALWRDYYRRKNKEKFPLHYVLIAGLAGLLPDIDILAYSVLNFFGFSFWDVHRTITHSFFFPLFFLLLFFIFSKTKIKALGKHEMTLHGIFLVIAFGTFMHLVLDWALSGAIMPFYPISGIKIGLNLVGKLPSPFDNMVIPILDAALLILWMIYMELKHKLSDFI